jgi:putative transposase
MRHFVAAPGGSLTVARHQGRLAAGLPALWRYIELNPLRANMVPHPAAYRWSSYRENAQRETDALVKRHPLYTALGLDAPGRQPAYRDLFRYELEPRPVDEIRQETNGDLALGNDLFAAQVSAALGRRAAPGKSRRPRKAPTPESGKLFQE